MTRNNRPLTDVQVSYWHDHETVDYFDELGTGGDVQLHTLAVKIDHHHIQRYDETDKEDVVGYTYKLFNPGELTLDKYESMKTNGYEFIEVTAEDLAVAFHLISGNADEIPRWGRVLKPE